MPSVENGKQNKHEWNGSLSLMDGETINGKPLESGQQCLFVKINRDSHFISQGTVISRYQECPLSEAIKKVQEILMTFADEKEVVRIENELKMLGKIVPTPVFVEILEINYESTPPLAIEINALTDSLFRNDAWLKANRHRNIGYADIKLGMKMPPLD